MNSETNGPRRLEHDATPAIVENIHHTDSNGVIQPPSGESRKHAAHSLLQARRGSLILRARQVLLTVLLERGSATIDDVRKRVALPDGVNPKVFGPVPSELATAGIISGAGFAKSKRPESHARPVRVWRLRDRDAALAWLDAHPDRPDRPGANAAPTLFDMAARNV